MLKAIIETMNSYYFDNELGYHRRKKIQNSFIVTLMVITWYVSAVIAVTTSKEIMNNIKFPFFLCTTQFTFASILSAAYLKLSGSFVPLQTSINSLIFQISVGYTFGFVLTNIAFSIVSAGFAETIKSAEPISTVILGLLFFGETGTTLRTYLTLVPICAGVGLSCYHSEEFNVAGFLLAAASNVCFSSRAVLAKKLSVVHPEAMDEINLFARISVYGLLYLLPITAVMEGRALATMWLGYLGGAQSQQQLGHPSQILAQDGQALLSVSRMGGLLLLNGSMFALYNLMSYVVLKHTDLVTHSVLNVFRRVFIIVFTSYYFGIVLSAFNMTGVATAVGGIIMFGYFRSTDKPKSYL